MWLTGFDVPCCHTMYVDKPMKGHSLMQAIARVNRARLRFPLLTEHRVVSFGSGAEVSAATKAILASGWCVDNDAYLFPSEGGWLAYVGHHDELVVYAPRHAR